MSKRKTFKRLQETMAVQHPKRTWIAAQITDRAQFMKSLDAGLEYIDRHPRLAYTGILETWRPMLHPELSIDQQAAALYIGTKRYRMEAVVVGDVSEFAEDEELRDTYIDTLQSAGVEIIEIGK